MTDKKSLDDFWDIDSLIPERAVEKSPQKRPTFDTSVSEIRSEGKMTDGAVFSGSSFTRFIPPHTAAEYKNLPKPEYEYSLEHSLVHDVKIYAPESKYNFYDRFYEDAKRLKDTEGEKCPPVPFFSYTPQYSQMNRAQLSYYLWWRGNARRGVYLEADYSYVMLYIYELLNLSEDGDKRETLDMMCNLWLRYGEEHSFVGKYLGEWVCDFCLIHRLPVPSEKLKPLYPQIMKNCLIKEFYVVGGNGVGTVCADTLVEAASAYDYRKSRYATEEKLPILRKHLVGALDYVLTDVGETNPLLDGMRNNVADNSMSRTSFSGALCTGRIRRRIEIKYYSLSRSYELRYLVSDIMKYSENKLRRIWGIKSRLSIYALPTSIKTRIDEYFDRLMPTFRAEQAKRERADERAAEYERLYDVPHAPLSLDAAARIEESSWETTRILIEAFEDEIFSKTEETVSDDTKMKQLEDFELDPRGKKSDDAEGGNDLISDFASALGDRRFAFLMAILDGDAVGLRKVADGLGKPSEAVVDEINELAADMLGDVLIEDDDGYSVIEDYVDMVEEMRRHQKR